MFGDLNFRLEMDYAPAVWWAMDFSDKDLEELKKADQLSWLFEKGRFYPNVVEGPITFPPSYKFNRRSNEFDTSKKMWVPSYCDRVLWINDDRFLN